MELAEFEKKVHALTELCRQLHAENGVLVGQVAQLRDERDELKQRLQAAEQEVVRILNELPAAQESGA
ncbi:MAG: hypothetical protein ACLFSG_08705 [Halothiobacillaceae bacterium]